MRNYPWYGDMVKGYKYSKPLSFDARYGHLASGHLPGDCIEACSGQGSVDDSVEYWRSRLSLVEALEPVRPLVEAYLGEYGAWDDLQTADMETLADRVLWTACCDIKEGNGWSGLAR